MMLTEKDLLKDIVLKSPTGSIWEISPDSWHGIVPILSEYLEDWNGYEPMKLKITDKNRYHLTQMIAENDIEDFIVHQRITNQFGSTLFESFDHMIFSEIQTIFPHYQAIKDKFSEVDFLA